MIYVLRRFKTAVAITTCIIAASTLTYICHASDDQISVSVNAMPGTSNNPKMDVDSEFVRASDGVWITGTDPCGYFGTNAGGADAFIAKQSSSGVIQWSHTYGSAADDNFTDIKLNSNGNLVVTGETQGNLFGATAGDNNGILACLSNTGTVLWTKLFPASTSSRPDVVMADGDVVATYTTESSPEVSRLVCYSSTGSQKWDIPVPHDFENLTYLGQSNGVYHFCAVTKQAIYQNPVAGDADKQEFVTFGLNTGSGSLILDGYQYGSSRTPVDWTEPITVSGHQYQVFTTGAGTLDCIDLTSGTLVSSSNLTPQNSGSVVAQRSCGDYAMIALGVAEYNDEEGSQATNDSIDLYRLSQSGITKVNSLSTQSYKTSYFRQDGSLIVITADTTGYYVSSYSDAGAQISHNKASCFTYVQNMMFFEGVNGVTFAGKGGIEDGVSQLLTGSFATVAAPTFSLAPGTYTGTQSVSISCATTGAVIRYTTDGSEPTQKSKRYSKPLSISTNTTVKARAFKTATLPSLRSDAVYIVKEPSSEPR